jgi:2-phosphosulfolactate phosphatase
LLCGELGGLMPTGFDINNSPAELHNRSDIDRPLVLLSSSGTKLMCNARNSDGTYIACFRNAAATAAYVAGRHPKVAVIGAGSRGDFRIEDQICCAWITGTLVEAGYSVLDKKTAEIMNRFRHVGADACIDGDSAHYLRRSGQIRDLDFILRRVDDLSCVAMLAGDELIEATTEDVMTEKVVLSAH